MTSLIGPFDVVGQVRVGVVGAARRERHVQLRLVDVVHARLEVVTEAAHAGRVPGEVVAELELVLLGRLRRVRVVADGHAVRKRLLRRAGARHDVVGEVGVLEDELVQLRAASTQLWFMLIELNPLVLSPQFSGDRRVAGAVHLRVRVAAVADRQVLRRA